MPNLPSVLPLTEADYELIEAAVMETVRGRWFLAEYARRNRHADTTMLLAAIDRLHTAVHSQRPGSADRIRFEAAGLAQAFARAQSELGLPTSPSEHPDPGSQDESYKPTLQAAEGAIAKVLTATEQIEDIVWTLREQGLGPELCDVLDAKAGEIYTACSDQDLIAQRTGKWIKLVSELQAPLARLLQACELESGSEPSAEEGTDYLDEPTPGWERADAVANPAAAATTSTADPDLLEASGTARAAGETDDRRGDMVEQPGEAEMAASSAGASPSEPSETNETLRRLQTLTPEEKIALFS